MTDVSKPKTYEERTEQCVALAKSRDPEQIRTALLAEWLDGYRAGIAEAQRNLKQEAS